MCDPVQSVGSKHDSDTMYYFLMSIRESVNRVREDGQIFLRMKI